MHSVKKIVKYIEQISQLEHLQNKLKDDMIEGVLLRKVSQNKNKKEMILDEFIAQYGGANVPPTDPQAPTGDSSTPAPTTPADSQAAPTTPADSQAAPTTPSTLEQMIQNLKKTPQSINYNIDDPDIDKTMNTFITYLNETAISIANVIKTLKETHKQQIDTNTSSNSALLKGKEDELNKMTSNYTKVSKHLNDLISASANIPKNIITELTS